MKLATYRFKGTQVIGAVVDNDTTMVPLEENYRLQNGKDAPHFANMLAFLRGGEVSRSLAGQVVQNATVRIPRTDVSLLAPVPLPESIRDFMAFERHILNSIRNVALKRKGACSSANRVEIFPAKKRRSTSAEIPFSTTSPPATSNSKNRQVA